MPRLLEEDLILFVCVDAYVPHVYGWSWGPEEDASSSGAGVITVQT